MTYLLLKRRTSEDSDGVSSFLTIQLRMVRFLALQRLGRCRSPDFVLEHFEGFELVEMLRAFVLNSDADAGRLMPSPDSGISAVDVLPASAS